MSVECLGGQTSGNGSRYRLRWIAAAVFGVTVIAVYWLDSRSASSRVPEYSATASVDHPALVDVATVPDVVLAEAVANMKDGAADNLRLRLKAARAEAADPIRVRTVLTYTDSDPAEAVRVVNRVAEGYARWQGSLAIEPLRQTRVRAHASALAAREDWQAARTDLDRFLAEHFRELPARTSQAASLAQQASEKPPTAASPPKVEATQSENAEWVEIKDQLARLKQRHSEMLMTRTSSHPAVKDLAGQIAQIEQRLADTPRQVAGSGSSTPISSPQFSGPVETPGDDRADEEIRRTAEIVAANAERFAAQSAAVESARQRHERLATEERRARDNEDRVPACEIVYAEEATACRPPSNNNSSSTLLIALLAGLSMAGGAAMAFSGATADLPLMSVAEIEATLGLPVLGTAPISSPIGLEAAPLRPSIGGTVFVVFGMAMMVVCAGMLWLFLV
ncbi:MAG: hypothetical protein GXY83_28945 [Rhodopirellula sp.]|nr:hypothetical protein [Rhodopirellula sp.]